MYCLDICEDAEVRERIEQLKSEQESKRLAEAQRRRVRRSQSNNTRYTSFFIFYSTNELHYLSFLCGGFQSTISTTHIVARQNINNQERCS